MKDRDNRGQQAFKVEGESVTFWLLVRPRARSEKLCVHKSGEWQLDVQAPPLEGEANEACSRFFARVLRLPQACVAILAGRRARRKLVRITGRSAADTLNHLETLAMKEPY